MQVRTHTASDKLSMNTPSKGLFFSYLEFGICKKIQYQLRTVGETTENIRCMAFICSRQMSRQPMNYKTRIIIDKNELRGKWVSYVETQRRKEK